jgi:hypothetical protein
LKREGVGFAATFAEQQIKARFILLATGIADESPDLPGLDNAVAKGSIRYCPVCDGYEAADQRIGVLGRGDDASGNAKSLRTYSSDVALLSLDDRGGRDTETVISRSRHKSGGTGPRHRAATACAPCCGAVKLCRSMSSILRSAAESDPNWRPPWERRRTIRMP